MKYAFTPRARFSGMGASAFALLACLCACSPSPTPTPPSAEKPAATSEQRNFTGTWTVSGTRQTLDMGAGHRAEAFRLGGSLMLSGAQRPGLGFRSDIIGLSDNQTGMQGRSVWTDERGDQVFSELSSATTGPGNLVQGRFIGGTGRYAGVTGAYSFKWHPLVVAEDGSVSGRAVGLSGWARLGSPQSPPVSAMGGGPTAAGNQP